MSELSVELQERVARVEIQRGPANFFDMSLIRELADSFYELAEGDRCRAIVLCSEGKHFCAGADFSGRSGSIAPGDLYAEAVRLFEAPLPFVAAIQGAAIGGGLGLALAADFRVACTEARFAANFARLGLHQGFGLSVTLPELVGPTAAMELLYTGRRVKGEEALGLGLCDRLVPREELRDVAHALAHQIALSAPLAVRSIRRTLRGDLGQRIREATDHERAEQDLLRKTSDFAEGVKAMAERREPRFEGH
ncbi:MAG: enoyl-CoA hydratase/isomerase family protein [bacterium]|nr:enoyl-CoA hydratase/isomerase family protein [bacterium]MCP5070696.1 enoyl-CoA hydratase/isomerase family protein [bacterium]